MTIVRNEVNRLPRLLASLAEFRSRGGEVLVLDTGSEDGTAEVAAAAGCRVVVESRRFNSRLTQRQARRINEAFSREGEGPFVKPGDRLFNFGEARAHAASLAKHNFQLAVDGGDVIEAMDVDSLDAVARSGRIALLQFETRVLSKVGWYLEIRGYLHDRRVADWRGSPHSFLALKSEDASFDPPLLPRHELFVSHHTDLEKPRPYQVALTAIEALAHPESYRWGYFLGRSLAAGGYRRSALPILMGLDRANNPPAVRSAALCFAAHCVAGSGGSRDEVDAFLFRAALRDSQRRDPLMRLAQRSLGEGDLQGAVSFAAAALAIPAHAGLSEPEENQTTGPHAIMYWALFWLGRREEAKKHFEMCRKLDSANPRYLEHARLFDPVLSR